MKLKRRQLVWTLLAALWLGAWALPMAILQLKGDTDQLAIYFGMWVAVALIPTVIVYVVGLLIGKFVTQAVRRSDQSRPVGWRAVWLFASIGWALLVSIFLVVERGPSNPFFSFAMPLATAIALLIVLVPPAVLYALCHGLID